MLLFKQLNGWLRNKIIWGKHFAISWKVEVDGKQMAQRASVNQKPALHMM